MGRTNSWCAITFINGFIRLAACFILAATCNVAFGSGRGHGPHGTVSRAYYESRLLFEKVWKSGEPSPTGGDGLGPLFNDRSCVACHHLGGTGGAGGNRKNVLILSAFSRPVDEKQGEATFKGELEEFHPGFRNGPSIELHKHATSMADGVRLTSIRASTSVQTSAETKEGRFGLGQSERSTPALFGAGLIDSISDRDLIAAEEHRFRDFPEIRGRISRLGEGKIGRFGWKGQTAHLEDFVMAACANELGLEVPGHPQPSLSPSQRTEGSTPKLDLDERQCGMLTQYVRSLPAPVVQLVGDGTLPMHGRWVFDEIGCAACHVPQLGQVDRLYSDLLLHDLGDRVRAMGGGYSGSFSIVQDRSKSTEEIDPSGEAGPNEWRTTPLWGVADSPPYLHDGRAPTMDEAIRLHGGEAARTSDRYSKLGHDNRQALLAFLHSLKAPEQPRRLADWAIRKLRGGRR